MVIKANIVETKEINVNLNNQGVGGINAPVLSVNNKTGHVVLDANDVGALPKSTSIPAKVSQLENDEGFLKSYTETDPTVPAWAKEPQKPNYTFAEVGADPEGSAVKTVTAHNTNQYSHQDIRLLIDGLNSRLNALADSDDVTLDQMSELVAYIKDNRELIEGVTTNKVNVSDIINNLTTNVADKPLAAAMGVELVKRLESIKIPVNLSDLKDDSTHRVVSDAEKARWNSKSEFSGSYEDLFDKPFGETWLSRGSDMLASDNIIYGGYHKVSNTVPLMEDIEKGYTIKYYRVSNGVITGDPITLTNSNADMSVSSSENGILINSDGLPLVIVSFTGIGTWSALTFYGITSPGVYFLQADYICVESIKLTGYDGFPLKVLRNNAVKTVNYIVPDKDGNVNVEGGSGGSNDAFDIVASDTLTWDGDTEGKVVAHNTLDPTFFYVRTSSVIPTVEQLQKGGVWATVGTDGLEYDNPFTSENISETSNLIDCFGGYILIAKEDNVRFFTDYEDITLPKAGIYFVGFTDDEYVSKLKITDFTQFTKPILRKESLPVQHKDWYGVVVNNGNTAVGDAIVHGGFVKVSDSVPTEAELRAGGTIRYYNVENGEITGDLITANYLESPYGIFARAEGMLIACDGVPIVAISINGSPNVGPFIINAITSPGVYFVQDKYSCVHSLTIDGYTGFEANYSKIPMEFIPDGIGGGVSSWNDLTDKPFGETTTYNDTITWDGNTEGIEKVDPFGNGQMLLCYVSDKVPTYSDFANGAKVGFGNGGSLELSQSDVLQLGDGVLTESNFSFVVVPNDNITVTVPYNGMTVSLSFPKKGIYFGTIVGSGYAQSLTINGYNGFETTTIDYLDNKFLEPFETVKVGKDTLTWDGNTEGLDSVIGMSYRVSDAVPTLEELQNGGIVSGIDDNGSNVTFTINADSIVDAEAMGTGTNLILVMNDLAPIFIATQDGATMTEDGNIVSFDKAGVYFARVNSAYHSSFTINGYTGFTEDQTKLKPEYAHPHSFIVNGSGHISNITLDKTMAEMIEAYNGGMQCYLTWNNHIAPLTFAIVQGTLGMLRFETLDSEATTGTANLYSFQFDNSTGTEVFKLEVHEIAYAFTDTYTY